MKFRVTGRGGERLLGLISYVIQVFIPRRFFSQSGPRFFATALAHALHRFPASTHTSKRPSTSGYSVRVDLQSGRPPSPETCNAFFRLLSRHALHAMHGLFVRVWVILFPGVPIVMSNLQYTSEFALRGENRGK